MHQRAFDLDGYNHATGRQEHKVDAVPSGPSEVPQDAPAQAIEENLGDRLGHVAGDTGYRAALGAGKRARPGAPAFGEQDVRGSRHVETVLYYRCIETERRC